MSLLGAMVAAAEERRARDAESYIYELWEICDDGWGMSAMADQWWGFTAYCPHGEWHGVSDGWDLSSGLGRLVESVRLGHPGAAPARRSVRRAIAIIEAAEISWRERSNPLGRPPVRPAIGRLGFPHRRRLGR